MRRVSLAVALCLLYALPASAQTGIPTSWTLRAYSSVGTPISTTQYPANIVACDRPVETGADNIVNPQRLGFDDPARTGRMCVADITPVVNGLADGNYYVTLSAVNADGSSAESARSNPFVRRRPNPPAAPTAVKAIP